MATAFANNALKLGIASFALAVGASSGHAQTAPYVLPYTMSTFAGPHAQYTANTACGSFVALDGAGDGCLAAVTSIGVDPHDIRVDGQGNIYWIDDNASTALIHKISAVTGRMTVFVGSTINTKGPCPTNTTGQGDGCSANDGNGNTTNSLFTDKTPKSRGLAVGPNGDVFFADYNGNFDHKISAATGIMSVVSGTGAVNTANPPIGGPVGSAQVNASRGIGVDAFGNVYIADTGDGMLRVAASGFGTIPGVPSPIPGNTYGLTVYNPPTTNAKTITSGVPLSSAILNAPEDVQVDSNGNIYIADAGNSVVRAVYMGKGSLPGISSPIAGYIYTVAGNPVPLATGVTNTTYPNDGTAPTVPALSVNLADRKIALDNRNNLYIADSSNNTVWFVDNATANIRLLAGNFGATAGASAIGCPASTGANSKIGDGCPGPLAALYSASNMGVSPDNQGNVYITDAQGGIAANARLRKLLSGLNFPSLAAGTSVTQTLFIHFAAGDSLATGGFTITGAGTAASDYTLGAQNCVVEADTTTDCTLSITFTPTRPGYDTSTLSIHSAKGGANSYLLTGTGVASAVAIDPGSVTLLSSGVSNPQGIVMDGAGNVYTADTGSNRVLVTTPGGVTTTFAGTGSSGNSGDGGLATAATLNGPKAVTVDTSGSVYIADTGNNTVRKVTADGLINTIAGGATSVCTTALNTRGDGCPATQATFNAPAGLAADNLGVLYVSDTGNNVIRAISTFGYVSTLAGGGNPPPACGDVFGDGCPASQTTFKSPAGLAYDATGKNLIVADAGNSIVRSIYLANVVVTPGTPTVQPVVQFNPVTLIAGTGSCGHVVSNNATATLTDLCDATGVAAGPAQTIFIADTGNAAIRLVSGGTISTILGVLSGAGSGVVPGSAANVQLTSPSAVAVSSNGLLAIADTGNNRLLGDQRAQVSLNFGRINLGSASPIQTFVESSAGTVPATLPSPLLTASATQTLFTLTSPSGSTSCPGGVTNGFTVGATCILQGQFTAATAGPFSVTYTEAGSNVPAGDPSITLIGTGAVLTNTTGSVAQTVPATGNAQFGSSVTLAATITPVACNTFAPACGPTGTVRFIVDGGNPGSPATVVGGTVSGVASQVISGLSGGSHIITCNYSGDGFYAASTCAPTTITILQAPTTARLGVTNNSAPQFLANNCIPDSKGNSICTVNILSATVTATSGIPSGTVTFAANGVTLGTSAVDPTTGIAAFPLGYSRDAGSVIYANNSLPPGSYTLTCTYSGSANFAASTCTGIPFVVVASPVDFSLTARGCQATSLIPSGVLTPSLAQQCAVSNFQNGSPLVAVAQGSTSDVTIFITPSNTVNGTLTFSCSGLPKASTCTFAPTSIALTAGTAPAAPVAVDMTLWTDLQPGTGVSSLRTPSTLPAKPGISLAFAFGWPLTLIGLAGIIRFRRKTHALRGLSLMSLLLILCGSSMVFTGCGGGPGAYQANLTPAGTYPIVVTVTGASVTHTTTIYWTVTSPGIPGQQ
jgi:sugar lactone lactonase YvrE